MYTIRCTVSGGVTGYRTSLMKRDGEVVFYENRLDCQRECDRLNKSMNGPFRTANFHYQPEEN